MKVLIVDDEPFIRDELKYFLSKHDDVETVGETGHGDEALELVTTLKPDVVFLDIELQYTNGISIARRLNEMDNPPAIVFATAYDKYAVLGYEIDVVDYILKPFSEARIAKTISKLKTKPQGVNETVSASVDRLGKICVSKDDKLYIKSIEDIVFFEAQNKSVKVICDGGEFACQYTLKELEEWLPQDNFVRVHKSFIVNLDHIEEIVPWFNYTIKLTMKDRDDEVIVNRSYVKAFKALLNI